MSSSRLRVVQESAQTPEANYKEWRLLWRGSLGPASEPSLNLATMKVQEGEERSKGEGSEAVDHLQMT